MAHEPGFKDASALFLLCYSVTKRFVRVTLLISLDNSSTFGAFTDVGGLPYIVPYIQGKTGCVCCYMLP